MMFLTETSQNYPYKIPHLWKNPTLIIIQNRIIAFPPHEPLTVSWNQRHTIESSLTDLNNIAIVERRDPPRRPWWYEYLRLKNSCHDCLNTSGKADECQQEYNHSNDDQKQSTCKCVSDATKPVFEDSPELTPMILV